MYGQGDANSDGTADNLDALELGLHFTQIGAQEQVQVTTGNRILQTIGQNNY